MHALRSWETWPQRLIFGVQWDHCLVFGAFSHKHTAPALQWLPTRCLIHTVHTHCFQVFHDISSADIMSVSYSTWMHICTDIAQPGFSVFCVHMHDCIFSFIHFSCTFSVSSFLTDLRLARRSMETLCLDPSSERRMASADTRTRRRLGLLNFPLRSSTLIFRSLIWSSDTEWREQDVGVSHGAHSVAQYTYNWYETF